MISSQFLSKFSAVSLLTSILATSLTYAAEQGMDEMWGESVVKLRAEDATRGQLFDEGNYAMFIHWGLYSQLANKVEGETYYGIGEWIMHDRMAGIPVEEYMALAESFNPQNFDAMAIARLAKDAGMKYIVITSKHHEGFAMFDSASSEFDIVDATPYGRDPLKELAEACKEVGVGFGVYYSHFQDWTAPGGGRGPETDAAGNPVSFEEYFVNKCLPQVEELTTNYGPLQLIWFDTPGDITRDQVERLIAVVRKNQPDALINGRAGHGLGDYQCLGDMEVPLHNVEGVWESVDTTNDSWAYAWYDENWKSPKEILLRVIGTVARGGTYMLNVGPRGDGSIPEEAALALRASGNWIQKYPQAIYAVDASPWKRALPWGDVTVKGNRLFLSVFDWPAGGKLYLPGLKNKVQTAMLLGDYPISLNVLHEEDYIALDLPNSAPDALASVIELELDGEPDVDATWAADPTMTTTIQADFSEVTGATKFKKKWMEKFGEWKHKQQVTEWTDEATAEWVIDILKPGHYQIDLSYTGNSRLVWQVAVEGGPTIRNQQAASHIYQKHPMGWIHFPEAGRYTVAVSCLEGEIETASLSALHLTPVILD